MRQDGRRCCQVEGESSYRSDDCSTPKSVGRKVRGSRKRNVQLRASSSKSSTNMNIPLFAQGVLSRPLVVSGRRSDANVRASGSSDSRGAIDSGTALSVEPSGDVVPGSSFGEATKRVEPRARVSGVTIMPFAPRSVSARSGSNESMEHRKHSREEQLREQGSAGSESELCPPPVVPRERSTSGVLVHVHDEGIFHTRRLQRTDNGDDCASEGEDNSDASAETDSSEDENFNSSVSLLCFGL